MARMKVKQGAAIESWEGVDVALAKVRTLEFSISNREAEKESDLAALKERHDGGIKPLMEERSALAKAAEEFVTLHRADLGKAKSKKLNAGTVGFRLGMPALRCLRGWNFKKVLTMVRERGLRRFVRAKYSLNKEALLTADLDQEKQKDLGVKVAQEEAFYYEFPARETVSTKG